MPGETLRARKQSLTRQHIARTAVELFRKQGIEETTVEEISAAALVSTRTFYRYFSTKVDTLFPYYWELVERWTAALSETEGRPPLERIRRATRELFLESRSPEENRWIVELKRFSSSSRAAAARQAELDRAWEQITLDALKADDTLSALERAVLAGAVQAAFRASLDHATEEEGPRPLEALEALINCFGPLARYHDVS